MRNIDVHFNGKANFQQVQTELNGIAKQMAAIDTYAQHMASGKGAQLIDVGGYRKSVNLMKNMRREFVDAVSSTGQFNVEQRRAISLTDEMTGKITKTKASFSEMFANGRVGFRQMARDIADQQALLQRAQVMHWGTDSKGRMLADVVTPRDISMIDDYAGSV